MKSMINRIPAALAVIAALACTPFASATSTASAVASLSFGVSTDNGTLSLLGTYGYQESYAGDYYGYDYNSNYGLGSTSATYAANSGSGAASLAGFTGASSSGAGVFLPPGTYGYAYGTGQGSADLGLLGATGQSFNLTFTPTAALSYNLNLGNVGVYAYGSASWWISVTYYTPNSNGSSSGQQSIFDEIYFNNTSISGSTFSTSPVSFEIPVNISSLSISWGTSTYAEAAQGEEQNVPDSGSTAALLGLALVGMVAGRRRLQKKA
jgi:hypothetical protein